MFENISCCRICGSDGLNKVFDLGNLVSCGIFPAADAPDPAAMPLEVMQCTSCGLVQLRHNFHQDELFRHSYGYRSGINEAMRAHLQSVVASVCRRVALRDGDIVLDIGSNDGTTLSFYRNPKLLRVGIDPTIDNFKQYYDPEIFTLADFFSHENFRTVMPSGKARVITSIAMFYDLPDPNAFVDDIRRVLDEDGVWVVEQSYLPTMVETSSFDTICHEHLEYYGLGQIVRLVERNGLRVIDASLNDVNGGSFQVSVCHQGAPFGCNDRAINALLDREKGEGYLGSAPFERLKKQVSQVRDSVMGFLQQAKSNAQLVHGYGASTKGNTLLQHFGISADLLPAIAERNANKFGCRTPGTRIPIISEEASRAQHPDYYFVLPWHFRQGFVARERTFLEGGGKLVFPLPRFEIVTSNDLPG